MNDLKLKPLLSSLTNAVVEDFKNKKKQKDLNVSEVGTQLPSRFHNPICLYWQNTVSANILIRYKMHVSVSLRSNI